MGLKDILNFRLLTIILLTTKNFNVGSHYFIYF
jgi:hypothetical protein